MQKKIAFPILAIALALSGCTALHRGWDGAMTEIGLYGPPQAGQSQMPDRSPVADPSQSAARQTSSAGESANWCRQYATSVAQDAARNGYDAPTQKRRYETTYQQCAGLPDGAGTPQ